MASGVNIGDVASDGGTMSHESLTNEHPVLVWVAGVLNDGDDVCSLLRHVDQVPPTAM